MKHRATILRSLLAVSTVSMLVVGHKTIGARDTTSSDWPMWGGTINRNMIATDRITFDFEPAADPAEEHPPRNIRWSATLGSQTYGNPVIAGGKVFVGTNNGAKYRPQHEGDRGCVLAFDEQTGTFLWQLTREKLPQGRVNDWPNQGICSAPCVENDRLSSLRTGERH